MEIVDDSEEETGDEAAPAKNSGAQPEQAKTGPNAEANVVSQFNMDSDTDVEEEEEKQTKAAPALSDNALVVTKAPSFHMDSDTDVEDDEEGNPPSLSNGKPKNSQVVPVAQTEGFNMDSDTDVEEDGGKLTIAAPPITSNKTSNTAGFNMDSDTDVEDDGLQSAKSTEQQKANSAVAGEAVNPNDFNLDSDTDVEEGQTDLNSDVVNSDRGETPLRSDAEPAGTKPAGLSSAHFDSDTDDEGILSAAVCKPPMETEKPDLEILSNSDTDVDDDSPEIQPVISKTKEAECLGDSGPAADVKGSIVGMVDGDNPAATGDSDTDVEEAEVKEKGDTEIPVLQREITPLIQDALQQNCSTPIQQPDGNLEEMETQAFASPSVSSYRRAIAVRKPATSSSFLDCQEEDFVVAETQSFIVNDRGRDTRPAEDPNVSSDLESSVNEKEASTASGGNFQLQLSDSSILRAQALAMESTQAFVSINLEETQPYADACTSAEREGPVDIALQATQAYVPLSSSDEEECPEDQTTGKTDQEVDQSVPQSNHDRESEDPDEEATQPADYLCAAPTQPMCFDDSDSNDSAPGFSKRKAKPVEEEETQQLSSVTEAETQPMEKLEDSASDDKAPAFGRKTTEQCDEEETQPNSDLTLAQTQPIEIMKDTDSEEDSPVFRKRKAKQLHLEEEATQPMEMTKDADSEEEDLIHSFKKRKVKRLEPVEDTQPDDLTVATTETEGSTTESPARAGGKQKPDTSASSRLALAQTQPLVLRDDSTSDEEEEIPAPRKRKARKLEDTQSLTNSQAESTGAKEEPSQCQANNVRDRPRRGGARSVKGETETAEEVSVETPQRQTRGRSKAVSKGRRGRTNEETQQVKQQDETAAKLKQEEDERKREKEERERKEREELDRLEKERIEKEKMAAMLQKEREEKERTEKKKKEAQLQKEKEEKERMERERREREEKERLEKERIEKEKEEIERREREEKEEMERMERERIEKELEAKRQKEKEEKEKREKEEKERLEKERIEKELAAKRLKEEKERRKREEKERLEKERIEKEKELAAEKERREKEEKEKRQKEEMDRLEKERIKNEKKELAAKHKKEKEEKKQKETAEKIERERKIKEQKEIEEKERLEAEKKAEEERKAQEKEELTKSKRGRRTCRRTTAAPESSAQADEEDGPARRTRSRSNSSNSVCSERSVSSISSQAERGKTRAETTPTAKGRRRTTAGAEASTSGTLSNTSLDLEVSVDGVNSQGRGRAGKQSGRGRRTQSEAVKDQASAVKAPERGRKSTRVRSEDDAAQPASTRGQGGAKDQAAKSTPEEAGNEVSQEEASTSRRGGKKRQAETETKTQEERELDSSVTRKTGARKSMKAEVPEEDTAPSEKPKGRSRASAAQRKKSDEQGDSSSVEKEANPNAQEPPQTPKSSVARKRQAADSQSDPVAKTPRSGAASPRSVGQPSAPNQPYKVLFTGVVDEDGEKVLFRLGGIIAKGVADMNCLVTDKVRRTVKFLCAVAKGIPIVTPQWLEKSGKAGTFLPPSSYLVKDREQENKFNFNLQDSLRVASSQPLLQGYEIHVTKSVKPEPVHMKDIIASSGAVFLSRMPSSNKPHTLVISCEDDLSLCAPALASSVPVVSAEFILTGILQQKVDFENHKLSGPASASGGRGRGRKKT